MALGVSGVDSWWISPDCIGFKRGFPSPCPFKDLLSLPKAFTSLEDLIGLMFVLYTNCWTRLQNNQWRQPIVIGVLVIWMFHITYHEFSDMLLSQCTKNS